MWELGITAYALTGTIWDLIKRELPVAYLNLGTVLVVLYQMNHYEETWYSIIGGAITGILFLILSKYSGEAIGYGDSWMILNFGIYHGMWKCFVLLEIAFGISFVFSCIGLWSKKLKKKARIPFFPFLMIGHIGVNVWW